MAHTKAPKIKKNPAKGLKKNSAKTTPAVSEEKDEEIDLVSTGIKTKKPIEIDATDILPEVDEKTDEESALAAEDEDAEDMPSLDSEDLNPFGDKWEE